MYLAVWADPERTRPVRSAVVVAPISSTAFWWCPRVTFDPNKAGDIDKPTIRKYPEKDYALTNAEGEFIEMDENILSEAISHALR